ncbi:MAG: D-tyrosyl-tRNA(Tyr) deacylase [Abditibacteriota bacterium]|nr:D-tyrosyl-tRNA(Tyr) deacylase [Abditibacteriota bacterium]
MICVIQRVKRSSVSVNGSAAGSVEKGLTILAGVKKGDTEREAEKLCAKICALRIFEDDKGKMNLSVEDIGGSVLVVSQFTLLADTSRGRRPSFGQAEEPERAKALYSYFAGLFAKRGLDTQTGVFGADMLLYIENDGPATFILSEEPEN